MTRRSFEIKRIEPRDPPDEFDGNALRTVRRVTYAEFKARYPDTPLPSADAPPPEYWFDETQSDAPAPPFPFEQFSRRIDP